MANNVFANTREISCKKADGKTICAFPDVCLTPPPNVPSPFGPGVPIPYPNTGMAKDTANGSRSVKISGQEIIKKNVSYYKTSYGDEAGTATPAKKGVITGTIKGKVYFTSWSMDVKTENKNVVRHLDMTTHNHGSNPNECIPWPHVDTMSASQIDDCKNDMAREQEACGFDKKSKKYTKSAEECCQNEECQDARKCQLVPYGGSGSPNCCPGQTGHHLLPNSLLQNKRGDNSSNVVGLKKEQGKAYTVNSGACVCVDGKSHSDGEHGELHDHTKAKLRAILESGEELTYEDAKRCVAEAHTETFKDEDGKPKCNQKCIESQIESSLKPHKTGAEIKVRQKDGMTRKNFDKYKDDGSVK